MSKHRAYYNENDAHAAQWTRNLIAAGHIMDGDVDDRSIVDVTPDDLKGYTRVHMFSGIALWDLALQMAGFPEDREVWTGSCPCQPFSSAGARGGQGDERHLWPEMFRLIEAVRPPVVFGEQVASADVVGPRYCGDGQYVVRAKEVQSGFFGSSEGADGCLDGEAPPAWADAVFADLESADYACGAALLTAASAGAPHIRQRLWWVADNESAGQLRADQLAVHQAHGGGRGTASGDDPEPGSEDGGLGDSGEPGSQGHAGHGDQRDEPGRDGAHAPGSTPATGEHGPWSSLAYVACSDGRSRPVPALESEVQRVLDVRDEGAGGGVGRVRPVAGWPTPDTGKRGNVSADGEAARMDARGEGGRVTGGVSSIKMAAHSVTGQPPQADPDLFPLCASTPGRVGRLRAYGNAIVPQVAATFVRAYLERD